MAARGDVTAALRASDVTFERTAARIRMVAETAYAET